jgi:hypothetical protein
MRRGWALIAVLAVMLGGYAEAGRDSSGPAGDLAIRQIQSFIAEQRLADAQVCTALGLTPETIQHQACIRDLAAKRRAQLEGAAPDASTGTDRSEDI